MQNDLTITENWRNAKIKSTYLGTKVPYRSSKVDKTSSIETNLDSNTTPTVTRALCCPDILCNPQ